MTQNILSALDDWLGTGADLIKPEIKSVAATTWPVANDPGLCPPAVDASAPKNMTFHDRAKSPNTATRDEVAKSATAKSTPAQPIEWRPLADAYYRHHFGCLHCMAAGQNPHLNRCPIGRSLWDAYRAAITNKKEAQRHG